SDSPPRARSQNGHCQPSGAWRTDIRRACPGRCVCLVTPGGPGGTWWAELPPSQSGRCLIGQCTPGPEVILLRWRVMPELVKQHDVVGGLDRAADDEGPSEGGEREQPSRHGGRKGCGQAPGYTGDACGRWAFVDGDDRHDGGAACGAA